MRLQSSSTRSSREPRAFTLVETMITAATLVIVMGSVIMCNLFGLSMAARQQIWMGASDDAAQAVGTLMGDIRSATCLVVGTFTNNAFIPVATIGQQTGNAIMIATNAPAPSTTAPWTTPWVLYYYDSVSNNLVRSNFNGTGVAGDFKLVSANPITNDVTHPVFTEVDCNGTTLSNSSTLAAISIYLSFTELQNPQVHIESGSLVDLYQIITTVSPRLRL